MMSSPETSNSNISIFSSENKWEQLMDDKEFVNVFLSDVLEEYIVKQRWYG